MARKLLFYAYRTLISNENPIKHSSHTVNKSDKSKSLVDEELDLRLSKEKLPDSFSVSIIMESQPSTHPWADEVWDASGIVVSNDTTDNDGA